MSFFSRLFGGGAAASSEPTVMAEEDYQGHHIAATPMKEGDQWRLCATVSKEIDGETRTHDVIRADLFASADDAARYAVTKAKQVIDEQGDGIYRS